MQQDRPLWCPKSGSTDAKPLLGLMRAANDRYSLSISNFRELHSWSVQQPDHFWDLVWDFCGAIGEKGSSSIVNAAALPGAKFFPEARLNFAENMLRNVGSKSAIVFRSEAGFTRRLSHSQVANEVSRLQQALKTAGVCAGDRVACILPNIPEGVLIMLATASIGAVFSSCSPDFGEKGILDRFGQIKPKILFACDGYHYAGKGIDTLEKVQRVAQNLPSLERVVIVPSLNVEPTQGKQQKATWLPDFLAPYVPKELCFERFPFDHPLYILFSSGTTGVPKCIVHCAGGILLQHLKEHQLHCGIHPGDRVFWFTTLGWMMWNWLVTAMASEATLMLYDGSPFHPSDSALFDFAQQEGITFFGTSAKFIDTAKKSGLRPKETHSLSSLRAIGSTGSPLAAESFDYVYDAIKTDVHLASVSGGTDLAACFVGGDPTAPVWRGEIQAPILGMAVDVWVDDGTPVREERGELVCVKPFPSMPIMFWDDPTGEKYHNAYFAKFRNVWCHGDFAEWTSHGGMIIHGRSDATLNPQGVRIGTAEIYAQVEQIPEVLESIAIGQEWESDTRIVLFVRLRDGIQLDPGLIERIRKQIRVGATPRHVPAKIIQIADIPRTRSGKITELAVRETVHGRSVKNTEALANPEALALYRGLADLKS